MAGDNRSVGYELYALAVPPGGDLEEAGETLLALLRAGHVRGPHSQENVDKAEAVVSALQVGCGFRPEVSAGGSASAASSATAWTRLTAASGILATVAPGFVRIQLPFDWVGDVADGHFERLFEALERVVEETGWQIYDPQDATRVSVDETGRRVTLDIYLSVMDQLRPGRSAV